MKKIFCICGIIVGIVMIIFGINAATFSGGMSFEFPEGYTFGADYYTEQYGATRAAAINVAYLGRFTQEAMIFGISFMGKALAVIGAAVICFFGYKLGDCFAGSSNGQVAAAPTAATDVKETAVDYIPDRVEENAEKAKEAEGEPEPAEEAVEEVVAEVTEEETTAEVTAEEAIAEAAEEPAVPEDAELPEEEA